MVLETRKYKGNESVFLKEGGIPPRPTKDV